MSFIYDHAPVTGLIFFFTFFVWVAYRAYRPGVKEQMQHYARIPLAEDKHHER